MKIDRKIIDNMLALPDEKLWQMLKLLMTANGANPPDKNMDPVSMRKLRAVLTDVTDADIERVMTLMDIYKSTH
ncbi:MAG: hypothetical protein IJ325_12435 [Clostridia bacterium]|nr:hypothetical protein [Clostridia bacterium]